MHGNYCTFARSTEEAAVWNLEKQTNSDHKNLIHLINQREKVSEHSRQGDVKSSSQSLSVYQEKLLEEFRRSSNEILIVGEAKYCTTKHTQLHKPREHSYIKAKKFSVALLTFIKNIHSNVCLVYSPF